MCLSWNQLRKSGFKTFFICYASAYITNLKTFLPKTEILKIVYSIYLKISLQPYSCLFLPKDFS